MAFVAMGEGVLVRGIVVAAMLAVLWPRYTELRRAPPVPAWHWVVAIGVGLAVFGIWITLDHGWMVMGSPGPGFQPGGWGDAALRLFGLALVVPVMEELFWRSFLLRWIDAREFLQRDPRSTSAKAFAVVCVLFALEHSFWLAGLIAGIAYTGLYVYSRNLWIPIVSHTTTNAALGLWTLATGNWRYW